ncbi:hypothetical protein DN752_09810 [Echinicola strongylocentroti]|uniref:Uncharacterized protein n=1 Tax=Echinicola strongylocentroti TaxID=1795355 RepID=A0A2Z4IH12_9BACT|nr:hypothetical protein DN752_09810 [Echinicola strongylocentroti]
MISGLYACLAGVFTDALLPQSHEATIPTVVPTAVQQNYEQWVFKLNTTCPVGHKGSKAPSFKYDP